MGDDQVGYIYKIDVQGMDILEYYEFNVRYPEEDVKEMWLKHATQKVGLGVYSFTEDLEVELITDKDEVMGRLINDGTKLRL